MAAIGLALMPLGMLSYIQAKQVQTEAQARAEAALFGETLLAAAPQVAAINRAAGAAQALALAVPSLIGRPGDCIARMRSLVEAEPRVSFAGFIPRDGKLTCGSTGRPHSFADNPRLRDLLADPQAVMTVNPAGPISGESVLIFSHPVTAADGAVLGFVSLSMPHRSLKPRMDDPRGSASRAPLELATFDADGTVLTALNGIAQAAQHLPADRPLAGLVGGGAVSFTARTHAGNVSTFAVVPLVEGALYVLSAWPPVPGGGFAAGVPVWAFPVAMWLASLMVAFLAAEYHVLRHIRALRRSMIAFARGNRSIALPDVGGAPAELLDVADAYGRMVDSVLHDEAALEDSLHQKEVLLREVHHRVKNNLQLIASIMNIQMRKSARAETRAELKGLHDRVMSLAIVHRELYQTSGLADVRADELLSSLVAQILRMGDVPEREIALTTRLEPVRLTPDQAVPLAMILTEALTNVLKHADRSAGERVALSVTLGPTDDRRVALTVRNSLPATRSRPGEPQPADSTGTGEQLLQAFTFQLGGRLAAGPDASGYSLHVDFPLRSLAEAEERFDEPTT